MLEGVHKSISSDTETKESNLIESNAPVWWKNSCSYLNDSFEDNMYGMESTYILSKKNRMSPQSCIVIEVI